MRLVPLLGTHAVAEHGIGVFRLHQAQRLVTAQVMTWPAKANLAHGLDRDRVLVHIYPPDTAQRLSNDVVVKNKTLETESEERSLHARRLVDHVQSRKPRKHGTDPLLPSRLDIRELGVRHAGGSAAGQTVEPVHLRAAGRKQRLLGRASGHRTRAKVRHEGPCPEHRRMPLDDRVHVDHSRKAFGNGLDDRRCNRSGRSRSRLARGKEQHRHSGANAVLHHHAALFRELHRRNDKAVRVRDEGTGAPFRLAAGQHVDQPDGRPHVAGLGKRCPDVLPGAGNAGIDRVQVEFEIVLYVAADHRALEEVDVVQVLHEAGRIVEVRR